jgi:Ca2+-binding EF-hand superfamily protein
VLSETLHRSIPPTLMQKYVAMHFHKHDKDGNELIDFDEFCGVYSQLFVDPEVCIYLIAFRAFVSC